MQIGQVKNQNQTLLANLMQIHGINRGRAVEVCARFGFALTTKLNVVPDHLFPLFRRFLERRYVLDKVLHKLLILRLRTFLKEGSYRAQRMLWNLPSHGQRSKTNAKTARRHTLARIPKNLYGPEQRKLAQSKGPLANKKKLKK
jgi:small subunit ribosomal protein S13